MCTIIFRVLLNFSEPSATFERREYNVHENNLSVPLCIIVNTTSPLAVETSYTITTQMNNASTAGGE